MGKQAKKLEPPHIDAFQVWLSPDSVKTKCWILGVHGDEYKIGYEDGGEYYIPISEFHGNYVTLSEYLDNMGGQYVR